MNPKKLVQKWLGKLIPTRHRGSYNTINQQIGVGSSLTADRLHAAITQAEQGDTQQLFAVYQEMLTDSYILSLLESRKRAAVKDKIRFQPTDKDNPNDVAAADLANKMFKGYAPADGELDDWQLALGAMVEGALFPVVLLSKRFTPSSRPGMQYELAGLKLVHPQLLDWTSGALRIADVDCQGSRTGTFHSPDPAQYVKHQGHLMTTNLNRGGPMRSLLFWWLFATMNRDWWVRFLDRFGSPFLIGKFNDGDDEGRAILESAFSAATKLLGVVVSNETEVEVESTSGGNSTGEAFERFRDTARKEMAILILGQNLSSESSSTGLGSGVSDLQSDVRDDMVEFDHTRLEMTLQRTVTQFLAFNGIQGDVDILFGGKKPTDLVKLGTAISNFKTAGLIVADESLSDLSAEVGYTIVRDTPTPGPLPIPDPTNPVDPTLPTPTSRKSLAGIQIQAAQKVLSEVTLKQTSPGVGKRLLASLGFDDEEAAQMIDEAGKFKPTPFSAEFDFENATDKAVNVAAAKLSRLLRESLSPVRQILADSQSPEDLEKRLAVFYAGLNLEDRASVTEDLLSSLAANGAIQPFS